MVEVYFLEWCNNLDYEDYRVTLLGVYTTTDKRTAARALFEIRRGMESCWPFNKEGEFVETTVAFDANLCKLLD
jgi:hypothetical protein